MTLETWTEFSARWPQDQSQQERAAGNWARMAAAQGIDPFGDLPESLHAAARAVMERNARARKIRMPAGRSRSAGSRSARTARRATGTPVAYEHSEDAVDGADALDGLTRPADIAPVIQELAQRHGVTIDSPVPYTREERVGLTRRPPQSDGQGGPDRHPLGWPAPVGHPRAGRVGRGPADPPRVRLGADRHDRLMMVASLPATVYSLSAARKLLRFPGCFPGTAFSLAYGARS